MIRAVFKRASFFVILLTLTASLLLAACDFTLGSSGSAAYQNSEPPAPTAAVQAQAYFPVPTDIVVKHSDAIDHHGQEMVQRVRSCFDKGGADRYHLLCRQPDSVWSDRIIEWFGGRWNEITAFEPQDSATDWAPVERWLSRKTGGPVTETPW